MNSNTVLMVAEKPSIAETIAKTLSKGKLSTRRGKTPVHEFSGTFMNRNVNMRVTSVAGHVFEVGFPKNYSNWDKVDPITLFDAPIVKNESSSKLISHLEKESRGCNYLVLWLDCDREGENICFEVINVVSGNMNRGRDQKEWIFRAKFSSISPKDISNAMKYLVYPNKNESDSVDVRQELDLKVGVAFSRLQTTFLRNKFGEFNKNSIISYGPCQTPTLFFAVRRRDIINSFVPEKYYTISATILKDSQSLSLKWCRSKIFDLQVARCLLQIIQSKKISVSGRVIKVSRTNSKRIRPLPLNTVNMLKISSTTLGIGPFQTLSIAEKLYLSGYITYPRTETSRYSETFDIEATISMFSSHPVWGRYSLELLKFGYASPRKDGSDAGDHPPITPVKSATNNDLSGDSWRLYDMICRHFLATVSRDASILKETIKFDIQGETFFTSGMKMTDSGFLKILYSENFCNNSREIPNFTMGEEIVVKSIELVTKETTPPPLLSESELLSLMEKNGIGTDASMPTHIQKIQEREYVKLVSGRRFEPTKLGMALAHGILNIDHELVFPLVRSEIEKYVDLIARGKYNHKAVLKHSLSVFKLKFVYFAENLSIFESLFKSSFTDVTASCSRISRCGQCKRYINYIANSFPQKLYCSYCDIYLNIPQGSLKLYKELKCPLDDFELLLCTDKNGVKNVFCPRCYNDPPMLNKKVNMLCKSCPNNTCNFSLRSLYLMACPNETCSQGIITLDITSSPDWRFKCSNCEISFLIKSSSVQKVLLGDNYCDFCGTRTLKILDKVSAETITGCPVCDNEVNKFVMLENKPKKVENKMKRGFRGRGRTRR
ncbi:DNA topoisomerase III beta-1 [Cryptosporidium ryanae]|uniref:DNA topoisomerase III beta-1 n=1 Tax=Cryptosporidium ryanae TaxID=515981 RepID=UPI00351A36A7|nr:DNA topoisomerase III beta-1 [Cryptosporidium ryanae]